MILITQDLCLVVLRLRFQVAENSFRATQKGQVLPDAVTVFLSGGRVFEGWKSVTVRKNLESIADEFSLEIDDKYEASDENWPIKPGEFVKINIGSERVLTGRIDALDAGFSAGERSFSVQGRSLAGDLIDSSCDCEAEFNNIELKDLAEKLVAPFGIKVLISVTPKIITKFAIKPSESVFEALNRAARLQGFFWVSTNFGNINLTRAGSTRSRTQLTEDINILSGSISIDVSERFSEYIVKGQSQGGINFSGTNASQPEGKAQDAGITRKRPKIIIAEGSVTADQAKDRAEWEATSRIAKSTGVSLSVQGWRQEDKSLWAENQLVHIHSKFLGLFNDMLITTVAHSQSNSGTTTDLTLVPKNSFSPEPVINKNPKDDLLNRIGANRKGKK